MRLFKNGIGNANVTGLTIGQNFLLGMFDSAYSIGDMIYSIADDPINALEGIVFILKAISPAGIITGESAAFINSIVSSAEKCIEEMGDGNANTIARKLGRVVGDIVIAVIADKGVNYAKAAISESLDTGLLSKLDLTMSEGNIVKVLRQRIFLKNANCVDDLVKAGIKSSDDLIKNGIINADDLLAKGITSADDLSKLGFSSVDDLVKLNIIGEENLGKFGINSIEELKKVGVTSADDFAKIGFKGVSKAKWNSAELLDELSKSGVKYNPDDVVAVTKTADGKLVWLENGNDNAGLQHILKHAEQFATKGVSEDNISDFIMTALKDGKVVGTQRTRTIYEVMYEGKLQRVAISVGDNGFIVGANPKSIPK
ncbi:hypothetical protein ACTNDG_11050 [Clostridium sp. HCP1S3_B4]|uniref:hypothetical protein n=1 Tax=unclassified Clostridium TaxID=2614128 RepID=UPI003F89AEDC